MINLAQGGLYTEEEVSAWESLLAFPTYHAALLRSLSLGACISQEICGKVEGQPEYDLRNMMNEQLKWQDPWSIMKQAVEKW